MNNISIIGFVLVATAVLHIQCAPGMKHVSDEQWLQFKLKYKKTYSDVVDQNRRELYEKNMQYIAQHNLEARQGKHTYTVGENQFADMSSEEYKQLLGYKPRSRKNRSNSKSRVERQSNNYVWNYCGNPEVTPTLPSYVNWTAAGWVTPVGNQGTCGSCWAFSACGALEGLYYNQTKTLVGLSEQYLIDCSSVDGGMYHNNGCGGGMPQLSFLFVREYGIQTSADYPYTEMYWNINEPLYGTCMYNASLDVVMTIAGFQEVDQGNEEALQQAVALTGPVSVAIDASSPFQFYQSGVYSNPDCSTSVLNHAVLAVGYGTYNNTDYWLIKNSWGTSWGMDGYIMMARNADNMCGIATSASLPVDYIPSEYVMTCPTSTA